MSKYVLRYTKLGDAKYISHLDFMRTIQRAMRRARLPLEYSKGFNPHPILSFALPLAVGISGEGELMQAEFSEDMSGEELANRLNSALPPQIQIVFAEKIEGSNNFLDIGRAIYEIVPENMPAQSDIDAFLARPDILVDKKTKKGVTSTDIKPDIFDITLLDDKILMTLSAGAAKNLNPMLVVLALNTYIESFNTGFCTYHRTKILDNAGNEI